MTAKRYVEGRLAFSKRWHPDKPTVSTEVQKLMDLLEGAGFDVIGMDATVVVKEDDAATDQQP